MTWTAERITELTELWECGCPTKEIGRIMGLTKNQVIGKAHRLKLPAREPPIQLKKKSPPPPPTMEARLRELWPHRTITAIAEDLGISRNRVSRTAENIGLPRRSLAAPHYWTPERVETLTQMHTAGASDEEIGLRLGKTKKAVRTKLSELGLLRPAKPPAQRPERGYIPPTTDRPAAISRHHTCQYIEGEPTADDSCKCGKPAQLGYSECPEHHAVCWQPNPHAKNKRAA